MALVESSRLWTTGGAGDGASTYTRDNMAEMFRNMLLADFTTQGVLNGLSVSGTASPLTLATGAACVYGFLHFCTTSGSLGAIATPAVGTTGGRVSLRADWTAQTVRAVCVRNTDGVSAIPSLTQVAGTTWDIPLYTFTITTAGVITLTDARVFTASPATVLTQGRITYAGNNGRLFDDANLTWDSTNHRLGINSGYALPLRGRQGGSATDWSSTGTTNQTLTTPRVQMGVIDVTIAGSGGLTGTTNVTFPVAFSQKPAVFITPQSYSTSIAGWPYVTQATGITASAFDAKIERASNSATGVTVTCVWIAIGVE